MRPIRKIKVSAVVKDGGIDSTLERDLQFSLEDLYANRIVGAATEAQKTAFAALTTTATQVNYIAQLLGLV